MQNILLYPLFILGFIIVIKGADFLIDGASSIAKKLNISDLVIGLTIVALGTSAPELMVNIIASLQGNTDIAIGNVLGSNIANIFLVLGLTCLIFPLSVQKSTVSKEIPFSLLSAIIMCVLANDVLIDSAGFSALTRIDGLVFISFFIIFMVYTFTMPKDAVHKEKSKTRQYGIIVSILLILLGSGCLALGGKWIVDGAVHIAHVFGVSESFIGLTIVAVGTTVPEIVTSIVAAFRKRVDISIGNVIGSNIFNIFFVLGISATIRPLPFNQAQNIDLGVMIGAHILLFIFMFTGRKRILGKLEGAVFLIMYISYITFLIYRG